MNLSISNIAWTVEHDAVMYAHLKEMGFSGLEIAPTRIFPEAPYDHLSEAKDFAQQLKEEYGLVVPSIQSIWYGRQEKVFGSAEERKALVDYTTKACKFAQVIGCKNLVFGNPRNRDTEDVPGNFNTAIDFFHTLGEIALEHDTTIAIEPNPAIYNTRFVNRTEQAVEMAYKSNSKGVKVNFDLGAVIENDEEVHYLSEVSEYINHIHISEPYLKPIAPEHENLHKYLLETAKSMPGVFVSIEMGKTEVEVVKQAMAAIKKMA